MRQIPLTQGKVALVDDADYELVAAHRWYALHHRGANWYAVGHTSRKDQGGRKGLRMHRLIMGAGPDQQVDHINGNTLDNRRRNLRLCTNAENQRNRHARHGGSSRFKGVTFHKLTGKWQANIGSGPTRRYLGLFRSEVEAARAYDRAAIDLFGEFANLNFPGEHGSLFGGPGGRETA